MSLDDFQLLDNEPLDESIIKGEFLEVYHQQGAQLNDQLQKVESISGENNNHHQVANSYLEFNISVRHPTAGFNNNAEIRFANFGVAFCFDQVTISTTGGMEIQHVKILGQGSINMTSSTSNDSELLSYFNKNNDTDENASMNKNSLNAWLNNSHDENVNRGRIKGHLPLKHIFGFCKTFKKITKFLAFIQLSKQVIFKILSSHRKLMISMY